MSKLRFLHPLAAGRLFLIALTLGLLAGCGGGGDSDSGSTSTNYVPAPSSLIGGTVVMSYGDGRSYTFTFNSSDATGVTRSDGKTTTAWSVQGLGGATMTLHLSYGTIYTGDDAINTQYDLYAMVFTSKTDGNFTLRENATSLTETNTPAINGTFKFTVYPPNG